MINIDRVSKIYNKNRRNQNEVLKETTLELPNEGFVFFVGKSGTGKSTMLNAIGGLISYEGEILFDNKKVNIEQYRRRNIGYIFQNFLIFENLSVYENISIALNLIGIYDEEEIHLRTRTLLKAVGLDINPSRRAGALSLGQRQRVAIARSLASNPKIILADEPTGNLDTKNSIVVMDILKKLSKNHLVICVTHNLGLINKYADKTFKIENKQLLEFDKGSSQKISDSHISQNINVANMEVDEYKDDNFLIKLYTQSTDKNSENNQIKIIRQNGKILVVGDNISIASKSEINFTIAENKGSQPNETTESISLDFDERKDKKSFKDGSFYKIIRRKLSTKPTFKTVFTTLSNIIFPFVLFILFNLLIGQINSLGTANSLPNHENAVFVLNEDNDNLSYEKMDYLNMLYEEDSGIVDYLSVNPFSEDISTSLNLDFSTNIENFDFTYDIISSTDFDEYDNVSYIVRSCEDYKNILFTPETAPVLADNQVYISSAIVDSISDILTNPVFEGQKTLEEDLIDSNIYIYLESYNGSQKRQNLEIKGIVESDWPIVLANNDTSLMLNQMNSNSSRNSRYSTDGILDNIVFLEYEDIKDNDNYTFINSFLGTEFDPSLTSASEESSLSFVSLSVMNLLEQKNYLDLDYMSDVYIENLENTEEKIVCFKDYSFDENTNDSSEVFINNFVKYNLENYYLRTDYDNFELSSGSLPQEPFEILVPDSFKQIDENIELYGDYTITGFYDDSKVDFNSIVTSPKYVEYLLLPDFNSYYLSNPGELIESSSVDVFISEDIEKTTDYFNRNSNSEYRSISYDEVFDEYSADSGINSVKSSAISLGVITGIFLIIIILSNFSYINKDKYRFGVLRCLGYSKRDLLKENSSLVISESVLNAIIPCLLFTILMVFFGVYNLGILWTIAFYLAYILLMILSSNLPLVILLRKKPVDIIGSLN